MAETPISKEPILSRDQKRRIRQQIKHEAQNEAYDNLLAKPNLRLLTRSQIRAMARVQVDRMFKELRSLKAEEVAAPELPPDTSINTNVPVEVAA